MLKWFQKQLGTLRKPSQGRNGPKVILAYLIFGAICVTFIFWGIGQPGSLDSTGAAAEVNNKIISVSQYRRRMEELERTYAKMFGGQMDFLRKSLPRQALEGLIQFELVSQFGSREGIWSTDEEIRDFITNEIPSFKENGQFRKTLYYDLLEANQLTPGEFEADIRKENLNRRLRRIFSLVTKPSSHEIQQERNLRKHQMNLELFTIKGSELVSAKSIADEEVQKSLAEESFKKEVQAYYDKNKSEFELREQVRARHILIKFQAGDSDTEGKALNKIKEIRSQLTSENFSELAKKMSEDAGSKGQGGDLGFFERGKMVPQFEEVAFGGEVGKISEPVKTSYGYHLIEIMEKKPASTTSLESATHGIARKLLAKKKVADVEKEFESLLKEGSVERVRNFVKRWKGDWRETGSFDLTQTSLPRVGGDEDLVVESFSLTQEHPVFPRLVHEGDQYYVLLWKESKEGAEPSKKGKSEEKEQSDEELAEEVERRQGQEAFSLWIEKVEKEATIVRNPRFASQQQEPEGF